MSPSKTTVDWMRFRTQAELMDGLHAVRALYGGLGRSVHLADFSRGKDGFTTGATVALADMALGRVDFGGDSQRGWVRWNLTGKGCEWVKDWDAIDGLEALPASEVRRLDVALTTWERQVRRPQAPSVTVPHSRNRETTDQLGTGGFHQNPMLLQRWP